MIHEFILRAVVIVIITATTHGTYQAQYNHLRLEHNHHLAQILAGNDIDAHAAGIVAVYDKLLTLNPGPEDVELHYYVTVAARVCRGAWADWQRGKPAQSAFMGCDGAVDALNEFLGDE